MRQAEVNRNTLETKIALKLNLDGSGIPSIDTKIPFFDHMLTLFAKHSGIDLDITAEGDIEVDHHHTVEDIGICLGLALKDALGAKTSIRRYGFFYLPMDECLCRTALDLSNRPFFKYTVNYPVERTGNFDAQLVVEFFQAIVNNAGMTLHIEVLYGENVHHIIEAIFKSFARALSEAMTIDPRIIGIPSTKGLL